ncbi:unnamed protein product [Porites lobata]|uniref:Uncharacterized protein n=1 Tax=Porites lobata TaxID=104759 RepID=A0ABN8PG82_9CNID|nr:unnamed protein product [Porites lobata]
MVIINCYLRLPERFHHGYLLILQLLEESLKGVATLIVPTITRTMAILNYGTIFPFLLEIYLHEDGSDVFDTVTQLDDEIKFTGLSPESGQVERVKATQSKQLSPNVNGTERSQQQKDINGDLKNNCRINKRSLK